MPKYTWKYQDGVYQVYIGTVPLGPPHEHPWQAQHWADALNREYDEAEKHSQRHLEAIRRCDGQS